MSPFESVLEVFKVVVVCGSVLLLAFLVLLALPASRLRAVVLRVAGYAVAVLGAGYVVMPFDAVPDVVPVVGWIDDGLAAAAGVAGFVVARGAGRELKELDATRLG